MAGPNAATINLTFASFVANSNSAPSSGPLSGSFCIPSSMVFANDNSGNPINASGQVTISGSNSTTKIAVKRNTNGVGGPIVITFNISGPGGVNYNPQQVYFNQTNGSGDGNGNNNFPQANRNPNDQSITISNNMTNSGTGSGAPNWNFYIQIKQMNSTQLLGWIDPIIENDA